jgi:flagellar biosynthesis protein FlhG
MTDQAQTLREMAGDPEECRGKEIRVISVTSGKGGVGKTNVVANLAYAMTRLGKRVLVLDADLGLGNLDVLLGLAPKYHIGHLLSGEKSLSEILIKGPNGMLILPASSGIQELTHLSEGQKLSFISELDNLRESIDILLIDTGAGISSNVLYFNTAAQEIIVVVSPEPTSITDAYAIMKVLFQKHGERRFKLIVNSAKVPREGLEIYNNLCTVADRYLDISIDYLGLIPYDENLPRAVREQKAISELYPDSKAGEAFFALAKTILGSEPERAKGNMQFLWKRLIGGASAAII